MKQIKFEEVLNDLVDYFLLGDPLLLMDYKNRKQLPDDLMKEFTTSMDGDRIVEEGILIPLSRVENYPYTIYFNLSGNNAELLKDTSHLQLQQNGYRLQVKYGVIYLFTVPYLGKYTDEMMEKLTKRITKVVLPNGWYSVSVLGGETAQETGMEPTFEFLITPMIEEPKFTADITYPFKISASEY